MEEISHAELTAVSYLNLAALGGRTVKLMPLWDGERWHWWIPSPKGLIEFNPVDAMLCDYVAKQPARPNDLWIPFVDLMWQRASWPEICPLITAISDLFHKMGTSVAKLRLYFDTRASLGSGAASAYAATELEYLVILARTVFDLIQEAISRFWKNCVRLNDDAAEKFRKASTLPDKFSKLILIDKKPPRTQAEIESKFGLPGPIAKAYGKVAPFFCELRDARDRIVHSGRGVGYVFTTERGFCVDRTSSPFRSYAWLDEHRDNGNLVSVLPWVAHLVIGTIDACSDLMNAVATVITFPQELAPGYRVFVRGTSTDALINVLQIAQGASVWWDDAESAANVLLLQERIRERAYHLSRNEQLATGDPVRDWLNAERVEKG